MQCLHCQATMVILHETPRLREPDGDVFHATIHYTCHTCQTLYLEDFTFLCFRPNQKALALWTFPDGRQQHAWLSVDEARQKLLDYRFPHEN